MIIDRDNMFSNAKELKASANSEVLDFGAAGDAIGQELTLHTVVNETFAGATSLTVKLQTSADNAAWDDVVISPAIPVAKLAKGKDVFCVRVPQGLLRYARLSYTVAGTGTAGKVTAFFSKDL
jgi:hypothetical protein